MVVARRGCGTAEKIPKDLTTKHWQTNKLKSLNLNYDSLEWCRAEHYVTEIDSMRLLLDEGGAVVFQAANETNDIRIYFMGYYTDKNQTIHIYSDYFIEFHRQRRPIWQFVGKLNDFVDAGKIDNRFHLIDETWMLYILQFKFTIRLSNMLRHRCDDIESAFEFPPNYSRLGSICSIGIVALQWLDWHFCYSTQHKTKVIMMWSLWFHLIIVCGYCFYRWLWEKSVVSKGPPATVFIVVVHRIILDFTVMIVKWDAFHKLQATFVPENFLQAICVWD